MSRPASIVLSRAEARDLVADLDMAIEALDVIRHQDLAFRLLANFQLLTARLGG